MLFYIVDRKNLCYNEKNKKMSKKAFESIEMKGKEYGKLIITEY